MENKITPETPDSLLIEHYLKGNEIALEYIINKHQQKIFNFIYSKLHDRDISEDIFQETFIKVIKTLKNGVYNEEGKFLPWVMRISHNLVIDFFSFAVTFSTSGGSGGMSLGSFAHASASSIIRSMTS